MTFHDILFLFQQQLRQAVSEVMIRDCFVTNFNVYSTEQYRHSARTVPARILKLLSSLVTSVLLALGLIFILH